MSADDFQARFASQGGNPETVVAMLVEGLLALETDAALGEQMIKVVISKRINPREEIRRMRANPHIARSYMGGTPEADYQDASPSGFRLDKVYSSAGQGIGYPQEGRAKFFVAGAGADTPRPVELACNNAGLWKVTNFSSLTVGVKKPPSVAGDF